VEVCTLVFKKRKRIWSSQLINTGGFDEEELKAIEERAYELGSAKHANLTIVDKYDT
jgi:hypothetical protein